MFIEKHNYRIGEKVWLLKTQVSDDNGIVDLFDAIRSSNPPKDYLEIPYEISRYVVVDIEYNKFGYPVQIFIQNDDNNNSIKKMQFEPFDDVLTDFLENSLYKIFHTKKSAIEYRKNVAREQMNKLDCDMSVMRWRIMKYKEDLKKLENFYKREKKLKRLI